MKRKPKPKPKRRRGRPEKYTIAQMVAAVQQNKGFLYLAAKSLGCHHSTVLDYRARYPEVAAAFDVQRGEMIDTGELALYNAVLKGEAWAVCFLLKTQGKNRGYVEQQRHEHSGPDGAPIPVAAEIKHSDADISAQLAKYAAEFARAAERHGAESDEPGPPGSDPAPDGLPQPVPAADRDSGGEAPAQPKAG